MLRTEESQAKEGAMTKQLGEAQDCSFALFSLTSRALGHMAMQET